MKKMMMNNKGFTLVEMVCVIAIILILSSALVSGFMEYKTKADERSARVQAHSDGYVIGESQVKSYLDGYTRQPPATTTAAQNNFTPNPGPAQNNNGGGGQPVQPSTTQPSQTQPSQQPQQPNPQQPNPQQPADPNPQVDGTPAPNTEIKDYWHDAGHASLGFILNNYQTQATKVVIYLPDGIQIDRIDNGNIKYKQEGNLLTIEPKSGTINGLGFNVKGDMSKLGKVAVISYS